MILLPYPREIAKLLSLGGTGNRSLLWDRGMHTEEEKVAFLKRFCQDFKAPKDFKNILDRRHQTLTALGARPIRAVTASRLVIGLGLPHSVENGFLFDRLTGCPYLPGSSVKGMLRAAAGLVAQGELEGSKAFWVEHREDLFGPGSATEAAAAKGQVAFYDAFPERWPELEVDVLTPHYKEYYENEDLAPADWYDPVPVPFLVVKTGQPFRFYFHPGPEAAAAKEIEALLKTALDWLGIGGKKSAGYGTFEVREEATASEDRPRGRGEMLRSNRLR